MKCMHCKQDAFINMDNCLSHWNTDRYDCDERGRTQAEVSQIAGEVFDAISELTDALEGCDTDEELVADVAKCIKPLARMLDGAAKQTKM